LYDAPKVIFDKNEIEHPKDPASKGEKHKALREHFCNMVLSLRRITVGDLIVELPI
jgi:hypothetical protein